MFSLTNTTKRPAPRVPFEKIKQRVLGARYELSVVVVGDTRMRRLNRTYRNRDATTDILAFPLATDSGEIFLSVNAARTKCKRFGMSCTEYLHYVFIHGLLHLKGNAHGRTMERLEDTWCQKLGVARPIRD